MEILPKDLILKTIFEDHRERLERPFLEPLMGLACCRPSEEFHPLLGSGRG